MKIAVFSDVHGKILLPFKLVDLYQKITGKTIDLILQCGDLGIFPNPENLDRATIKHLKNDPEELGFYHDFVTENESTRAFLDKLNINMVCVRGNHEDHDFLDDLEQKTDQNVFPVDIYKRVFICKSGLKQQFNVNGDVLNFVGIGRIGDRKGRTEKRFIQNYEKTNIKKLYKSDIDFDILISHDKSKDLDYGMTEIRSLLDKVLFHYHFYGHTGEDYKQELDDNGITQAIKVKELEYHDSGVLGKGSMIIVTKENKQLSVEVVEQKITNLLTKYNWREEIIL